MKDTFIVQTEISLEDVRCLLVSAFEGGSNYWMQLDRFKFPKGISEKDFKGNGKLAVPDKSLGEKRYWQTVYVLPFVEGGGVVINDMEEDNKEYTLNLDNIQSGLQVMAAKYPKWFAEFICEDSDCVTADVFLQCCLFGDIIYG